MSNGCVQAPAVPTSEQEDLLGWFKEQMMEQQEQRRSEFSSSLAEQSAAFAKVLSTGLHIHCPVQYSNYISRPSQDCLRANLLCVSSHKLPRLEVV